jgi:4-amino-4-deoxy-L-arabinose transferase-like glycosyltransferase
MRNNRRSHSIVIPTKSGSIKNILSAFSFFIVFLLSFILVTKMFSSPMQYWDERTNVEVIKELTVSSNPFVLALQGKPFFEKPPLFYIFSAIVNHVINNPLLSGRLVSVSSSLLMILGICWYLYRKHGIVSVFFSLVFLLSTAQLFVINAGGVFSSHTLWSADLDAMQLLFLVITFILLNQTKPKYMLAGITTALAVLTKGPLGFLPLLIFSVIFYCHPERRDAPAGASRSRRISRGCEYLFLSWITALLFIVPWYLFMYFRFGQEFLFVHFGYHIVERLVLPIEGHTEQWWYPIRVLVDPRVCFGFFPFLYSLYIIRNSERFLFLITVVFLCLPFFIQTKLAWYILPLYPFAALTMGTWVGVYGRQFIVTIKSYS